MGGDVSPTHCSMGQANTKDCVPGADLFRGACCSDAADRRFFPKTHQSSESSAQHKAFSGMQESDLSLRNLICIFMIWCPHTHYLSHPLLSSPVSFSLLSHPSALMSATRNPPPLYLICTDLQTITSCPNRPSNSYILSAPTIRFRLCMQTQHERSFPSLCVACSAHARQRTSHPLHLGPSFDAFSSSRHTGRRHS